MKKYLISFLLTLIVSIFIGNILTSTKSNYFYEISQKENLSSQDIAYLDNNANLIKPVFQPNEKEMRLASRILKPDHHDETFNLYGNSQNYYIYQGVPFSRYWQLEDEKAYVFHPMVLGRHIFRSSDSQNIETLIESSMDIGISLPNKGIAWYYPEHYPLNRMVGQDLHYSAISQSEILAGIGKANQENNGIFENQLKAAAKGLKYDYLNGGVALENVALLEIPLYNSAPEIILNGWLHALLHLCDYVNVFRDSEAESLLQSNVEFLSQSLPSFDAPKYKLSRYSDLSPYKIKATFESKTLPKITAFYVPKNKNLPSIKVPLEIEENQDKMSIYDNQITKASADTLNFNIACSQNYRALLVANENIKVSLNTGRYNPSNSTPGNNGERVEIASKALNDKFIIDFNQFQEQLICGYPTNFAKADGKNYYHIQHIVALLYLTRAYHSQMSTQQIEQLITYAFKWLDYTNHFNESKRKFANPQEVLDGINRGKFLHQVKKWQELKNWGKAQLKEN